MIFTVDQRDVNRLVLEQAFAAHRPPNPPPMITTFGRVAILPNYYRVKQLKSNQPFVQPLYSFIRQNSLQRSPVC